MMLHFLIRMISVWFIVILFTLYYSCLLIYRYFVIIYRKQAVENANVAKYVTKKAVKVATKRMKNAGKLLSEKQKAKQFYDEVLKCLCDILVINSIFRASKLTKIMLILNWQIMEWNAELTKEFLSVLDQCEFARYVLGRSNEAMGCLFCHRGSE